MPTVIRWKGNRQMPRRGLSGTERKQKEGVLFQRDLQPQRMNLTEGDVVYVYKPAPLGEREDGREKRVPVRILKLYRNHALCKVGSVRESFTYAEIAQGMLGKSN